MGTYTHWGHCDSNRCDAPHTNRCSIVDRATSLSGLYATGRRAFEVPGLQWGPRARSLSLVISRSWAELSRSVYRLVGRRAASEPAPLGVQQSLPHSALGSGTALGIARSGPHRSATVRELGAGVSASDLFRRDIRGPARHRGSCYSGELDGARPDIGTWSSLSDQATHEAGEADARLSPGEAFRELLGGCGSRGTEEPRHEAYFGTDGVDLEDLASKLDRIEAVMGREIVEPFHQLLHGYVVLLQLLSKQDCEIARAGKAVLWQFYRAHFADISVAAE